MHYLLFQQFCRILQRFQCEDNLYKPQMAWQQSSCEDCSRKVKSRQFLFGLLETECAVEMTHLISVGKAATDCSSPWHSQLSWVNIQKVACTVLWYKRKKQHVQEAPVKLGEKSLPTLQQKCKIHTWDSHFRAMNILASTKKRSVDATMEVARTHQHYWSLAVSVVYCELRDRVNLWEQNWTRLLFLLATRNILRTKKPLTWRTIPQLNQTKNPEFIAVHYRCCIKLWGRPWSLIVYSLESCT